MFPISSGLDFIVKSLGEIYRFILTELRNNFDNSTK